MLYVLATLGVCGIAFHGLIQDPVLAKVALGFGITFLVGPIFGILEQITDHLNRLDRQLSQRDTSQKEKEEPKS